MAQKGSAEVAGSTNQKTEKYEHQNLYRGSQMGLESGVPCEVVKQTC